MPFDIETQIQAEILAQEKAKTSLIHVETDQLSQDRAANRADKKLWSRFIREGVSWVVILGVVGTVAYWVESLPPGTANACADEFSLYQRKKTHTKQTWDVQCDHSDHAIAIETEDWTSDGKDIRVTRVSCVCRVSTPKKAPHE